MDSRQRARAGEGLHVFRVGVMPPADYFLSLPRTMDLEINDRNYPTPRPMAITFEAQFFLLFSLNFCSTICREERSLCYSSYWNRDWTSWKWERVGLSLRTKKESFYSSSPVFLFFRINKPPSLIKLDFKLFQSVHQIDLSIRLSKWKGFHLFCFNLVNGPYRS